MAVQAKIFMKKTGTSLPQIPFELKSQISPAPLGTIPERDIDNPKVGAD
jgi:hypothetical protein